jgi:hypothetical protein
MMGRKEVMVMLMAGLAVCSCGEGDIEVGKYQIVNETSDTVYVNMYGMWYSSANIKAAIAGGETYIFAANGDEGYEQHQYIYKIDSVKIYRDAERRRCVLDETRSEYYQSRYDDMKFYTHGGNWTETTETQKSGDSKIEYHTYTFHITQQLLGGR